MQAQCPPILRLSTDFGYKRPKVTIQDTFQDPDIFDEKLKDYAELFDDEILDVPLNTHIRYFTYNQKAGKELFRTGGVLHRKFAQYMILMGKECRTFSVQRFVYDDDGDIIYRTRFFKHLTKADKLENYESMQTEDSSLKDAIVVKQQKEIADLKLQLEMIKMHIHSTESTQSKPKTKPKPKPKPKATSTRKSKYN
jgi:hypothetical protein